MVLGIVAAVLGIGLMLVGSLIVRSVLYAIEGVLAIAIGIILLWLGAKHMNTSAATVLLWLIPVLAVGMAALGLIAAWTSR